MLRRRRIHSALADVEPVAFVDDLDDEAVDVDASVHPNTLERVERVAVQNRVRQRLCESNGYVEHEMPMREAHQFALASNDLYDAFDLTNVARNIQLDDADPRFAVGVGGLRFSS